MPIFEVEDPATKTVYEIDAPTMPSGAQLQATLLKLNGGAAAKSPPPAPKPAAPMTMLGRPVKPEVAAQLEDMKQRAAAREVVGNDVAVGVVKGAARTALDAGSLVRAIPGVSSAVDAAYGTPGLSDEAFQQARDKTANKNSAQTVGGVVEGLAELAVPVTKAVEALPSTVRAGQKFQNVMSAARTVPVNVNGPGAVALRIQQLAERGGSMPMAVRKFLGRITDPKLGEMTYEEARDFASNISRLSAAEFGRLTPAVGREVATLRVTLNKAVGEAAARAGKLHEYQAAMKEYARASKLLAAWAQIVKGAKRSVVPVTLGGFGYEAMQKLREFLGD